MAGLLASGIVGVLLGLTATTVLERVGGYARAAGSILLTIGAPAVALPVFRHFFPDPPDEFLSGLGPALLWCAFVLGLWGSSMLVSLVFLVARHPRRREERRAARIEVHELADDQVEHVRLFLPLRRIQTAQTYLVAWDGDRPVGHVHIAWKRSETAGIPDLQDLEARDDTVARVLVSAAEELARSRGYAEVRVSK